MILLPNELFWLYTLNMIKYKEFKLDNGLKVVLAPKSETSVVTVMLMFRVGSRNESLELAGISHVLEHMHYKGTKTRQTAIQVSEFIESVGGEHNAFTGKEYTGYYAKVASKHLKRGIDFISDLMLNSIFDSSELEKEKDVIIQEINMYQDYPVEVAFNNFDRVMYGDNSLGREVIGFKDSVKSVTREKLFEYKDQFYFGSNAALVIAGNFGDYSEEDLILLAEKSFPFLNKEKVILSSINIPNEKNISIIEKKTEQSNIIIGFRTCSYDHEDSFKLSVLALILGGSMSSRMFEEIREKRGLAYSVHTQSSDFKDTGYLYTQAGIEHGKVYEAVSAILAEYKKVINEKVTDSELDKAKEILSSRQLIRLEDSEEVAHYFAEEFLLPDKVYTPEQVIEEYQKVTVSDIQEMAKKYFIEKNMGMSFVGVTLDRERIEKIFNL